MQRIRRCVVLNLYTKRSCQILCLSSKGVFVVTKSTSAAAAHLGPLTLGHNLTKDDLKTRPSLGRKLSVRLTFSSSYQIS